jgi:hypothetical protein
VSQRRLGAIAGLAARGLVPSVALLAHGGPLSADAGRWRMAVTRLRRAGLLAPAAQPPSAGRGAPLWPGPDRLALEALLGADALAAWEDCRDRPSPDDGWVRVGGEVRRAVDGMALAAEPREEDVALLRGGVARGVVSGALMRWEVVDVA